MHLVRFRHRQTGQVGLGVDVGGTVKPLPGLTRLADALRLSLDELRARCESAAGEPPGRGETAAGEPGGRRDGAAGEPLPVDDCDLLPPVDGRMEVWAAGVTYTISKQARMAESERAASIYEKVYDAARPELFFKSAAWRVVGDGEPVAIRDDSEIDVPEPELAVVVNSAGEIVGYLVCDDVSSRTIEGDNPLYLPQAKMYLGSCSLSTGIRPAWEVPDPYALRITLRIERDGAVVWQGEANTGQLHRRLADLVAYLRHAEAFPDGVILSTGTCLVPPLPFTLLENDVVEIAIDEVGRLRNPVARGLKAMDWLVDRA